MMLPENPENIVDRLLEFERQLRQTLIASRQVSGLNDVARATAADTIYSLDMHVEPLMEEFFQEWGKTTPLVLIAEGFHDEHGHEGEVVFPRGTTAERAKIRVIVDPIDGTRGLMYDKRSAWCLAGVAPNRGAATRLRDIEVSVMTELPTSKMGFADAISAIKGGGARANRIDLGNGDPQPVGLNPSTADNIDHGFAMISHFFPATKVLAGRVMEELVQQLIGPSDVTKAVVFDDQYISTGGQWYELMIGHDRFNADLRPIFYGIQKQPPGLSCHPYDCAAMLIAEEAGISITDGWGAPLDGPLDTTTGLSWAAYANASLKDRIQPLLSEVLCKLQG